MNATIKTVENLKEQGYVLFAFVTNDGIDYKNAFKSYNDALVYLIDRAGLEDEKEFILSGEKSIHDFGDFFNLYDIDDCIKDLKNA